MKNKGFLLELRDFLLDQNIYKEYQSKNSSRAINGDLKYWQKWLELTGFDFNEKLEERHILNFIFHHYEFIDPEIDKQMVLSGVKKKMGTHSIATIIRRVYALSGFLEIAKIKNVCRARDVYISLSIREEETKLRKIKRKSITKEILMDMIATCKDEIIDIRDKALLLVGWASGGRRRSEIVNMDMQYLRITLSGEYLYIMPDADSDRVIRKSFCVYIKDIAATALKDWLSTSNISAGIIFRSVKKGGHITRQLSDEDVYRIVRLRLKKAGYNYKEYNAHSLRSGFVEECGIRNESTADIMAAGGYNISLSVTKTIPKGNAERISVLNEKNGAN